MRKSRLITALVTGLATLALACEGGVDEFPNEKDCVPDRQGACTKPSPTDEEGEYVLYITAVPGPKASKEVKGWKVKIDHNARGGWFLKPLERNMPLQNDTVWKDRVRAPKSRPWVLYAETIFSPGNVYLECKVEWREKGPRDGEVIVVNSSGNGGKVECHKPAGK